MKKNKEIDFDFDVDCFIEEYGISKTTSDKVIKECAYNR